MGKGCVGAGGVGDRPAGCHSRSRRLHRVERRGAPGNERNGKIGEERERERLRVKRIRERERKLEREEDEKSVDGLSPAPLSREREKEREWTGEGYTREFCRAAWRTVRCAIVFVIIKNAIRNCKLENGRARTTGRRCLWAVH